MAENYLTEEGKAELEKELKHLIEVKRPELANKLKEAKEMGDLSENADYIDAKEQQGFLEGRIREIEGILRSATIIQNAGDSGVILVGSEVTIMEEGSDTAETYRIVGAAEADPAQGKISNESPLGAALLNKKRKAKVKVKTPSGDVLTFRIVDFK